MKSLFPPLPNQGAPHRVAATGAGVVTSLGLGWEQNAEGFRVGKVAIRPVSLFDVQRQRSKSAAEVDLPEFIPDSRLSQRKAQRLERAARMLLLAALEAWQQSGWDTSEHLPGVFGTTSGGMQLGEDYFRQAVQVGDRRTQATRTLNYQPQVQALNVMESLGCRGPVTIITNACASGANAVGHAWELVRSGQARRVICGGYDALCQLVFAGFDSLQALSTTTCRPFDRKRDGLALGEGAAVLTLERMEDARNRGADILAEVAGYGACTDVHHLTQPHPDGAAALMSMQTACTAAGIDPSQLDYINAHGTGTSLNDSAESVAINRLAGNRSTSLAVSSTKASVGHLLGAAGAVEAVVSLMSLQGQWLPPTATLREPDPVAKFKIVHSPTDARVDTVLSNSFGFGGANASLLFRRMA
jgi:3-oxoacyl-[acyl-carrier-protein] synthase II